MQPTKENRLEVLKIRLTREYSRTLKSLQVSAILSATADIKDKNERNIKMLELAKTSKYSLSGIARAYLNKAVQTWLPEDVLKK